MNRSISFYLFCSFSLRMNRIQITTKKICSKITIFHKIFIDHEVVLDSKGVVCTVCLSGTLCCCCRDLSEGTGSTCARLSARGAVWWTRRTGISAEHADCTSVCKPAWTRTVSKQGNVYCKICIQNTYCLHTSLKSKLNYCFRFKKSNNYCLKTCSLWKMWAILEY